jgi:hypothetical protein
MQGIVTMAESESSEPRHPWARNPVGDLNECLVLPERKSGRVSSREDADLFFYRVSFHLHKSSAS